MQHVTSADGTPIAVHTRGSGAPVVVVGGALSTAADAAAIADSLAAAGFTALTYDRRARADSGDTPPYDPDREVDDLAAVLASAAGPAVVLGHSSGAVLALYAASSGTPIRHLFLSEPPLRFGVDEPPADLGARLQQLIDDGRPGEAVTTFQREAVGLPEEMIAQFAASPMFDVVAPLGQSTVYDTALTARVSTPTAAMLAVRPVTILCGAQTFPVLVTAARRLAQAMPHAEFVELTASVGHRLDGDEAAAIIARRVPAEAA
ncbi:alpha/beta hydrolase [Microbacterium sp. W1N]|uniref:alpha/beta fold hydrolase n=1 Tax=Microbacterium festucae TaxID=2977531 RepID=UPI0021BE3F53|nr:alpha/beta hydrolase [Microbacterium festucae]MCT9820194.1 alpha/beta hydrolase [Microbacterium festucae]